MATRMFDITSSENESAAYVVDLINVAFTVGVRVYAGAGPDDGKWITQIRFINSESYTFVHDTEAQALADAQSWADRVNAAK